MKHIGLKCPFPRIYAVSECVSIAYISVMPKVIVYFVHIVQYSPDSRLLCLLSFCKDQLFDQSWLIIYFLGLSLSRGGWGGVNAAPAKSSNFSMS